MHFKLGSLKEGESNTKPLEEEDGELLNFLGASVFKRPKGELSERRLVKAGIR